MSIPLLAQGDSSISIFVALVALAVALFLAVICGVLNLKKIVGPPRIASNEAVSILWMILLLGLGMWIIIPATYGAVKFGAHQTAPATAPSTLPLISLDPAETVILGLASAALVFGILLLTTWMVRADGLRSLGLTKESLKRTAIPATIAILIILPLMFAASEFTQRLWQLIGLEHPNAHPLLRIFQDDSAAGLRALVIISAILVAPMFEELLFRGYLQTAVLYSIQWLIQWVIQWLIRDNQTLSKVVNVYEPPLVLDYAVMDKAMPSPSPAMRWLAIGITSFLFALVHQELWMMPPIFLLSLCLGYVYERTGNLWVSILIHAAFNSANVALFVFQRGQ